MRIQDVKYYLTREPKKILKAVKDSPRNTQIAMLNDYYRGDHWIWGAEVQSGITSRTTRSAKEVWKRNLQDRNDTGLAKAQIKTWNRIKSAVNTYTNYLRGDQTDNITISTDDDSQNNIIKGIFPDPN